ncbi:hypothetical protein [Pseudonocardia sp. ICBG1142]|uniref:hypothetical protein n=1 Tax=Pseudonocardia sp. ICBG1142 TaxID=2846760 RepID=UPI001CF6DD01|nr:hypothetical protein [Pseudonocardia sp. ICBG1142]
MSALPVPGRTLRPVPAPVARARTVPPGRPAPHVRTAPPARTVLPPADPLPVSSAALERLRENLRRVLAGLRWPAHRWQILAEVEAWGVSGLVREQLVPLPDGRYPSFEAVVELLTAAAHDRLRPAPVRPAVGADRLHPLESARESALGSAGVPRHLRRAVGGSAPGTGHRPA